MATVVWRGESTVRPSALPHDPTWGSRDQHDRRDLFHQIWYLRSVYSCIFPYLQLVRYRFSPAITLDLTAGPLHAHRAVGPQQPWSGAAIAIDPRPRPLPRGLEGASWPCHGAAQKVEGPSLMHAPPQHAEAHSSSQGASGVCGLGWRGYRRLSRSPAVGPRRLAVRSLRAPRHGPP